MPTHISNLGAYLEVPIWKDILVLSIETVTVKTDNWIHFHFFPLIIVLLSFLTRFSGPVQGPVRCVIIWISYVDQFISCPKFRGQV